MLAERVPLHSQEWCECVVAQCQVFIGEQTPTGFDIVEVAARFVRILPDARCHGEDLLLRALLLDVADRWGTSLHNDLHQRTGSSHCGFDMTSTLREFLNGARGNAKQGFLKWARYFRIELDRAHPVPPAHRAAAIIRQCDGEQPDAATLAAALGVSSRQLRRAFLRTYGMSLPEYLRRVRLLKALEVMTKEPGKVEHVALHVGYRSKKDFYRVFRRLIGMTPTTFMKLPPDSARSLIDRTRLTLMRPDPL